MISREDFQKNFEKFCLNEVKNPFKEYYLIYRVKGIDIEEILKFLKITASKFDLDLEVATPNKKLEFGWEDGIKVKLKLELV